MTNYEHYRKDIEKLARFGIEVALKKDINRIVSCDSISCDDCLFYFSNCADRRLQWADEEYIDPEVDWTQIPVDTKIWVRESEELKWHPRYFAKYKNDKVYAWDDGATSFSVGGGQSCTSWKYAKLAEKVENDG